MSNENLMVKISADISELQKEIEKGQKTVSTFGDKVKSFGSAIGSGMKTAGKVVGTAMAASAAAVGAVTTSFVNATGEVAAYGDNIDKMSQKMGMSAQGYQEWDFIMQHCGTSMETMKASMKTLATAAETGSDAFAKLGISQQDIANMSQEELFNATISALQNVESETERTYIAGQLLGKGATELGALLNTSAEDTEAMRQQVHDLGGVMSDEAVKSAAAYQDSLQNMQVAFGGLKNNLLSGFMPSITTVMDGLAAIFSGDKSGIGKVTEGIQQFVTKLSEVLPDIIELGKEIVLSLLEAIVSNLPQLINTGITLITSLIEGIVQMLPSVISAIVEAIPLLIEGIVQAAGAIVEALPEIIQTIADAIPTLIPQFIEGITNLILIICENLMEVIMPIIEALPSIIQSLIDALITNLPIIIQGLISLIIGIVENLPTILITLIDAVPQIIAGVVTALIACLPDLIKGVIDLVVALCKALPDILKAIWKLLTLQFTTWWETIKSVFSVVKDWFGGTFGDAWEAIKSAFSAIGSWFKGIWDGIKNVFSNVGTWFKDKFKQAVDGIKNIFNSIKSFFSGIWNSIKTIFTNVGGAIADAISGAVKGAINKVLSFATNVINGFISAINLAISIINAIPGVNISKLNKLSVPKLARGGIIDSATLAVVGEQGKEAVVPLENNLEWLDKLAGMLNARMGGGAPIYLMVDKRVLGQVSAEGINDITRQTGAMPLVIA